jgi:N-acetylglucosamine-6-sulfatase
MSEQSRFTRRFLLHSIGVGAPFAFSAWTSSSAAGAPASGAALDLPRIPERKPRNIIFVLTDDHRYDAIGFMSKAGFPETPNLDRLARDGAHFRNAFVTTALCSPSRASILTGLYAHQHRVVDNNHPIRPDLVFFPQYLQRAGYETAHIGKWHMGGGTESDAPQRGFDHWVSFQGQGSYLPTKAGLNVNGKKTPQRGYITDELTDYALQWLERRDAKRPFYLCLSHKAVHSEFIPAARHKGRYADRKFIRPPTWDPAPGKEALRPMWVQNQRNSWHGVDFPYHTALDIGEYYKSYAETLLAVDDSVGRLMDHLQRRNELESTLIVYMGDNGFAFGEHGLIDKRTAYEESMRVPLLMHCPELIRAGSKVEEVVANIDMAPTLLETAGLRAPAAIAGTSALPLAQGERITWRDALLYEYYWERNFPQTPTVHAIRGHRYKYIRYQGLWDIDELFDLQADPLEANNLIFSPGHEAIVGKLNRQLFEMLAETDGLSMPLSPDEGSMQRLRRADKVKAAEFPPQLIETRKK